MNMERYISYLYDNYSEERVSQVAERLLLSFARRKVCSTYQSYKDLKTDYEREGKTITYKNVHKRIQILFSKNLIEKAKSKPDETTKHGAILYRITSLGIFYLFKNRLFENHWVYIRQIILENKNDSLFALFLYPYIQPKTIENLTDYQFIKYIYDYLAKCCDQIKNHHIYRMKELEKTGGWTYTIGFSDTLADFKTAEDPYTGSIQFVQYIRENSDLKWLDEKRFKMVEVEKNKEIKIIQEDKVLSLYFDIENLKAGLFENNEEKFRFKLENYGKECFMLTVFKPETVKEYPSLESNSGLFDRQIRKFVNELVLDILQRDNWLFDSTEDEFNALKSKDELRRDKFFVNAIENFKEKMDFYFNRFFT